MPASLQNRHGRNLPWEKLHEADGQLDLFWQEHAEETGFLSPVEKEDVSYPNLYR